ncbi:OstA-like protein [Pararcticibacter amylolyticus]|uniref:Organic solvent tolerance-like N-terminal domain-containing protein n=1 Tax=Pararcticibacter amylolyticus TaxID=2173175 RepID=A0A2U2PDI0_9SPHI|nr:OstA-like protein [Pararcticibacter amylolyticus]PWG79447.1 hypothetical protein DDR33_16950 [Pararcticibacter amylolyticus]
MRKIAFLFILLTAVLKVSAQRRSQIQLTSSLLVKGIESSTSAARFIRPVFTHEGSTLAADSADYNQAGNAFDAYGHVVITQPDGTVIYSDLLNYDGNTRIAILTHNVRMVDKDAILTTNYLTYNMGTKIGTYIGGGKIENGQNVLTSKNGYYFANTRDAYFRYDVVVNTPDALIKTDTLKYNTESKISWFYGPTDIYGKGQNKQSKLYTENGRYNTLTDQAWFGKNNLYTEGTKSLKGDSLFYDGKAGFGKAINNITFTDTEQKVTLKGNQGIYRKGDESALVTRNAYVVIETEQDSAKVDSIWMTADTLRTKLIPMKEFVSATNEELKSDAEISTDPVIEGEGIVVPVQNPLPKPAAAAPPVAAPEEKGKGRKRKKKNITADVTPATDSLKNTRPPDVIKSPGATDSVAVKTDSLKHIDSLKRVVPPTNKGRLADTVKKAAKPGITAADSASKKVLQKDSLAKKPINPADTVKVRVIYAFHKVKIFKSDLQSRSDSAFYSYADSIIRTYKNPIIWTQGSQLTADTIYMQMKNRKLDNMLLQHNGFVVSTEGDSTKFNQVKGKVITGLFENSRLKSMFVDGNAESIYYTLEDSAYTGMNRSLSSRMRLTFGDNKLQQVMFVRKPEGKYYPIENMPKDIEILDGFIWKPKDRPKSKEEIIPGPRKRSAPPAKKAPVPASKGAPASTGGKSATGTSVTRPAPPKQPLPKPAAPVKPDTTGRGAGTDRKITK